MAWKAISLIVCRMRSRLQRAKRLQDRLGWTENCSAFSRPCITWLMGVSHPLGHSQELESGVSHCSQSGFDQSSAFVVERRYFISVDSKLRCSVQGYCHRTFLPPIPPTKDQQKQMTSQVMFCFHWLDYYKSLLHSLLPSMKGIVLGWFQSSSLLAAVF